MVLYSNSPPDDLYERPENAFVAQFIGENNKLRGTVSDIDGDYCVVHTTEGVPIYAMAINVAARGDCLLYTSPSPRDRTRSRMPSSA